MDFKTMQSKIFTYIEMNQFEQARIEIKKYLENPIELEFKDKLYFWLTCIYIKEYKFEQAHQTLNAAIDDGIWWNPATLKSDKDILELSNHVNLEKIMNVCTQRYSYHAKQDIKKVCTLRIGNPEADFAVFAIHGRDGSAKRFSQSILDDRIWDKYEWEFVESPQIFSMNGYCWDDADKAVSDLRSAYGSFQERVGDKPTIVIGFSQGCKALLQSGLLNNDSRIKKTIMFAPAFAKDTAYSIPDIAEEASIQIVTGEQDYFLEGIKQFYQGAMNSQLNIQLEVIPGLGHDIPTDMVNYM